MSVYQNVCISGTPYFEDPKAYPVMLFHWSSLDAASRERLAAALMPPAFSGSFDCAPINVVKDRWSRRSTQDDRERHVPAQFSVELESILSCAVAERRAQFAGQAASLETRYNSLGFVRATWPRLQGCLVCPFLPFQCCLLKRWRNEKDQCHGEREHTPERN